MRQQFIALFGRSIQADGIIDFILCAEGNLFVAAIHAAAGSVDQMIHRVVPARLQNVIEADEIALNVHIRMFNRITDTSLSRQIDHNGRFIFGEHLIHQHFIGNVPSDENMLDRRYLRRFLNQ